MAGGRRPRRRPARGAGGGPDHHRLRHVDAVLRHAVPVRRECGVELLRVGGRHGSSAGPPPSAMVAAASALRGRRVRRRRGHAEREADQQREGRARPRGAVAFAGAVGAAALRAVRPAATPWRGLLVNGRRGGMPRHAAVVASAGPVIAGSYEGFVKRALPGSVTEKRAPPNALAPTAIRPPWRSTTQAAIARPRPLPPGAAAAPRQKRSKTRSRSAGRDPGAVVLDDEAPRPHGDQHAAAFAPVPDRVVHQDGDEAPQPVGVAAHRRRLDVELQAHAARWPRAARARPSRRRRPRRGPRAAVEVGRARRRSARARAGRRRARRAGRPPRPPRRASGRRRRRARRAAGVRGRPRRG